MISGLISKLTNRFDTWKRVESAPGIESFDDAKSRELMMFLGSYSHAEKEEFLVVKEEDDSHEGSGEHFGEDEVHGISKKTIESSLDQQRSDLGTENKNEAKSHIDYFDDDDDADVDVIRNHQNLVNQMRMELKNNRNSGGLCTISEESETVEESFKPVKFDKKIVYKDVLKQIHMFYKSYSERMKKLDILNYQTLHAISFIQLKEPQTSLDSKTKKKTYFCFPWLNIKKVHHDPLDTPMSKMDHDLELVYVGQLCLSWEMLRWISRKARELIDYDPLAKRTYNRADEMFQMFQVLLRRFMEDEEFEDNRIHYYVRSRNTNNGLLHVPNIEDDCLKSRRDQTCQDDMISIKELFGIIYESKAIFRDFVSTDSKFNKVALKKVSQEAGNMELLMDIMTTLHQKEKRVKSCNRSDGCRVKKLETL